GKNYSYDELPDKYKDKIQLPKFDKKYLDKPGNVFPPTNNKGECTELTWAYMSQLYSGEQPTNGDGYIIYKAYKEKGAKTTHNPTVGYGFSSSAHMPVLRLHHRVIQVSLLVLWTTVSGLW